MRRVFQTGEGFVVPVRTGVLLLALILLLSGCALRPVPLNIDERQAEAARMQKVITTDQEPITAPMDLYEAMARAVKYNLNYRLKLMEEAISMGQSKLVSYDLLPKLTLSAGYTERDNVNASVSKSVATGETSLEASTSQDKVLKTTDLTLSWNILDFGVSYFQAKQQADKYLIFTERRRKALHNLLNDVRYAFWRAVAVQQLETKVRNILKDAEQALQYSSTVEKEKLKPIMDVLMFQKVLLEIRKKLEMLQQELALAKVELAHLLNLPPGTEFKLKIPENSEIRILKDERSLESLEILALEQRPELMEINYQKRISANETKKTIASLFPGINFSVGYNYDSNSYLVNNDWASAGVRVAWNLMSLVAVPQKLELVKTQEKILEMQQMTLSMAVLSQLHIAYRQYRGFVQQFEINSKLEGVNKRIFEHVKAAHESDAESRVEKIRAETNAIMAELQRYQSYAQLQNALGRILASIGHDPLPGDLKDGDINVLAEAIRKSFEKWGQDYLAPVPLEIPLSSSGIRERALRKDGEKKLVPQEETRDSEVTPGLAVAFERKPAESSGSEANVEYSLDWLIITKDRANIRPLPGTRSSVISHVLKGNVYKFTGSKNRGWYQILMDDGTEGWIAGEMVRQVEFPMLPDEFTVAALITSDTTKGISVRKGPGTHYDECSIALQGASYPVISATANWVEVRLDDGSSGWVTKQYMRGVDVN